jgi:hypothetical protein
MVIKVIKILISRGMIRYLSSVRSAIRFYFVFQASDPVVVVTKNTVCNDALGFIGVDV